MTEVWVFYRDAICHRFLRSTDFDDKVNGLGLSLHEQTMNRQNLTQGRITHRDTREWIHMCELYVASSVPEMHAHVERS
jgi:hypothetical protein